MLMGMDSVVQPLLKTAWQVLKKLDIELPYNPAIAMYPISSSRYVPERMENMSGRLGLGQVWQWLLRSTGFLAQTVTNLQSSCNVDKK